MGRLPVRRDPGLPLPAHAQNADQAPELSASEAQKGGYVFDRGSRFVEDKRLKISIIPLFETFRSQAPLNVGVRLQWAGPGLLEGRMLVDLYANERYVGSWKSPDLAVNDQVLSFPMILPPSPLYDERDPYNLRIAFETEDRVILMDQRDLPVESGWSRNYVVGIVAPETVSRISGFLGAPDKPAPRRLTSSRSPTSTTTRVSRSKWSPIPRPSSPVTFPSIRCA